MCAQKAARAHLWLCNSLCALCGLCTPMLLQDQVSAPRKPRAHTRTMLESNILIKVCIGSHLRPGYRKPKRRAAPAPHTNHVNKAVYKISSLTCIMSLHCTHLPPNLGINSHNTHTTHTSAADTHTATHNNLSCRGLAYVAGGHAWDITPRGRERAARIEPDKSPCSK